MKYQSINFNLILFLIILVYFSNSGRLKSRVRIDDETELKEDTEENQYAEMPILQENSINNTKETHKDSTIENEKKNTKAMSERSNKLLAKREISLNFEKDIPNKINTLKVDREEHKAKLPIVDKEKPKVIQNQKDKVEFSSKDDFNEWKELDLIKTAEKRLRQTQGADGSLDPMQLLAQQAAKNPVSNESSSDQFTQDMNKDQSPQTKNQSNSTSNNQANSQVNNSTLNQSITNQTDPQSSNKANNSTLEKSNKTQQATSDITSNNTNKTKSEENANTTNQPIQANSNTTPSEPTTKTPSAPLQEPDNAKVNTSSISQQPPKVDLQNKQNCSINIHIPDNKTTSTIIKNTLIDGEKAINITTIHRSHNTDNTTSVDSLNNRSAYEDKSFPVNNQVNNTNSNKSDNNTKPDNSSSNATTNSAPIPTKNNTDNSNSNSQNHSQSTQYYPNPTANYQTPVFYPSVTVVPNNNFVDGNQLNQMYSPYDGDLYFEAELPDYILTRDELDNMKVECNIIPSAQGLTASGYIQPEQFRRKVTFRINKNALQNRKANQPVRIPLKDIKITKQEEIKPKRLMKAFLNGKKPRFEENSLNKKVEKLEPLEKEENLESPMILKNIDKEMTIEKDQSNNSNTGKNINQENKATEDEKSKLFTSALEDIHRDEELSDKEPLIVIKDENKSMKQIPDISQSQESSKIIESKNNKETETQVQYRLTNNPLTQETEKDKEEEIRKSNLSYSDPKLFPVTYVKSLKTQLSQETDNPKE